MSSDTSADRTTISYDRNGNGPPVILVLGAFNERATGHHWRLIWPARSPSSTTTGAAAAPATTPCRTRSTAKSTISRHSSTPRAVAPQCSDTPQEQYSPCAPPRAACPSPSWRCMTRRSRSGARARTTGETWPARSTTSSVQAVAVTPSSSIKTKGVGIPPEVVAQLRQAPFWPALEAIAHSLAYESLILACPPEPLGSVSAPTLVIHGETSRDPGSCPRSRRRTSPRPVTHAARSDPRPGS